MAGTRPDAGHAGEAGSLHSRRLVRASLVVGVAATALVGSLWISLRPQLMPVRAPTPTPTFESGRATLVVQSQFIDGRTGWSEIAHPPDETSDGLYATTDGGRTWRISFNGLVSGFRFFDRKNGMLVDSVGGVYASADGGRLWVEASRIPDLTGSTVLRVGLGDDGRIVALLGTPGAGSAPAWSELVGEGRPLSWSTLGPIDITSPGPLVVEGDVALVPDTHNSAGRVLVSHDGARTWTVPSWSATETPSWSILSREALVVGLDTVGQHTSALEISTDGGGHWEATSAPFRGGDGVSMACRPDGHCVASDGVDLWQAQHFGASWSGRAISTPVREAESLFYAADGTLFAVARTGQTDRLLASPDDGHTWRALRLP